MITLIIPAWLMWTFTILLTVQTVVMIVNMVLDYKLRKLKERVKKDTVSYIKWKKE